MARVALTFCYSKEDWSAKSSDTINFTVSGPHLTGRRGFVFDKANGAANTIYAAVVKDVSGDKAIDLSSFLPHDKVCWCLLIPDLTNVAYSYVRLGTNANNYAEWRFADTSHTAGRFTACSANYGDAHPVGGGVNPFKVEYVEIGVAFDLETNTLVGIVLDCAYVQSVEL